MNANNPVTLRPRSDRLRMHGLALGVILLVASLLVASSVTAVINFILVAIPVLTIAAVIAMFVVGVPMGIQAHREAHAGAHSSGVVMNLEGFWKHAHSWDRGRHPHFVGFQQIDHDIAIHLDSKSDENPETMRDYTQMTAEEARNRNKGVEQSLEGLTDYRRV